MKDLRILLGTRKGARDLFIWDKGVIMDSLVTLGILSKKEQGDRKKMMLNGGRTKMMMREEDDAQWRRNQNDDEGRERKHCKLVFHHLLKEMMHLYGSPKY